MPAKKNVSAAVVRDWVRANPEGLPPVGKRGRLHPEQVTAFHKANPGQRYEVGKRDVPTITVTVPGTDKNGKSRPRKRTLPVSEVRTLAGEAAGERGRLSPEALTKAAEALASQQ